MLPYACHKHLTLCYSDHICVSDALNSSQQLLEKCRSVLIREDKRMWSNISLITADNKPCRNPYCRNSPKGDFMIRGCVSWLAETEVISIPSRVEILAVAAAAVADDSAEHWHRADEADESCARRPEEGRQRGRQICSTSKLEAARGLFKERQQNKPPDNHT